MTRKDYPAIAAVLAAVRASYAPHWDANLFRACNDHAVAFADALSVASRFNAPRFLNDAGVPDAPNDGGVRRSAADACEECGLLFGRHQPSCKTRGTRAADTTAAKLRQLAALKEAARAVIANWSSGDLASAVNQLEEALLS